MAKCKVSGKGPMTGNNRPWSNKATRRTWQPNVQKYTVFVPELGRSVKVRMSARALKSVDKLGLMPYLKKNGMKIKDVT